MTTRLFRSNPRALVLLGLLVFALPSVSWANAYGAMGMMIGLHLYLGIVLLGIVEGYAISRLVTGQASPRSALMIVANAVSYFAGVLFLIVLPVGWFVTKLLQAEISSTLFYLLHGFALLLLFGVTLLTEYPFAALLVRKKPRVRPLLPVYLGVQTATTLFCGALYLGASDYSLVRNFTPVPVHEMESSEHYVFVFHDPKSKTLRAARTDGTMLDFAIPMEGRPWDLGLVRDGEEMVLMERASSWPSGQGRTAEIVRFGPEDAVFELVGNRDSGIRALPVGQEEGDEDDETARIRFWGAVAAGIYTPDGERRPVVLMILGSFTGIGRGVTLPNGQILLDTSHGILLINAEEGELAWLVDGREPVPLKAGEELPPSLANLATAGLAEPNRPAALAD